MDEFAISLKDEVAHPVCNSNSTDECVSERDLTAISNGNDKNSDSSKNETKNNTTTADVHIAIIQNGASNSRELSTTVTKLINSETDNTLFKRASNDSMLCNNDDDFDPTKSELEDSENIVSNQKSNLLLGFSVKPKDDSISLSDSVICQQDLDSTNINIDEEVSAEFFSAENLSASDISVNENENKTENLLQKNSKDFENKPRDYLIEFESADNLNNDIELGIDLNTTVRISDLLNDNVSCKQVNKESDFDVAVEDASLSRNTGPEIEPLNANLDFSTFAAINSSELPPVLASPTLSAEIISLEEEQEEGCRLPNASTQFNNNSATKDIHHNTELQSEIVEILKNPIINQGEIEMELQEGAIKIDTDDLNCETNKIPIIPSKGAEIDIVIISPSISSEGLPLSEGNNSAFTKDLMLEDNNNIQLKSKSETPDFLADFKAVKSMEIFHTPESLNLVKKSVSNISLKIEKITKISEVSYSPNSAKNNNKNLLIDTANQNVFEEEILSSPDSRVEFEDEPDLPQETLKIPRKTTHSRSKAFSAPTKFNEAEFENFTVGDESYSFVSSSKESRKEMLLETINLSSISNISKSPLVEPILDEIVPTVHFPATDSITPNENSTNASKPLLSKSQKFVTTSKTETVLNSSGNIDSKNEISFKLNVTSSDNKTVDDSEIISLKGFLIDEKVFEKDFTSEGPLLVPSPTRNVQLEDNKEPNVKEKIEMNSNKQKIEAGIRKCFEEIYSGFKLPKNDNKLPPLPPSGLIETLDISNSLTALISSWPLVTSGFVLRKNLNNFYASATGQPNSIKPLQQQHNKNSTSYHAKNHTTHPHSTSNHHLHSNQFGRYWGKFLNKSKLKKSKTNLHDASEKDVNSQNLHDDWIVYFVEVRGKYILFFALSDKVGGRRSFSFESNIFFSGSNNQNSTALNLKEPKGRDLMLVQEKIPHFSKLFSSLNKSRKSMINMKSQITGRRGSNASTTIHEKYTPIILNNYQQNPQSSNETVRESVDSVRSFMGMNENEVKCLNRTLITYAALEESNISIQEDSLIKICVPGKDFHSEREFLFDPIVWDEFLEENNKTITKEDLSTLNHKVKSAEIGDTRLFLLGQWVSSFIAVGSKFEFSGEGSSAQKNKSSSDFTDIINFDSDNKVEVANLGLGLGLTLVPEESETGMESVTPTDGALVNQLIPSSPTASNVKDAKRSKFSFSKSIRKPFDYNATNYNSPMKDTYNNNNNQPFNKNLISAPSNFIKISGATPTKPNSNKEKPLSNGLPKSKAFVENEKMLKHMNNFEEKMLTSKHNIVTSPKSHNKKTRSTSLDNSNHHNSNYFSNLYNSTVNNSLHHLNRKDPNKLANKKENSKLDNAIPNEAGDKSVKQKPKDDTKKEIQKDKLHSHSTANDHLSSSFFPSFFNKFGNKHSSAKLKNNPPFSGAEILEVASKSAAQATYAIEVSGKLSRQNTLTNLKNAKRKVARLNSKNRPSSFISDCNKSYVSNYVNGGSANSEIPLLLVKCINMVETIGLESEGLYRISGSSVTVDNLKRSFLSDPKKVNLRPPPHFSPFVSSLEGGFDFSVSLNRRNHRRSWDETCSFTSSLDTRRSVEKSQINASSSLSTSAYNSIYDNDVHVLTGVIKSFLREGMPPNNESLCSSELYEGFILAAKNPDWQKKLISIQDLVHSLPPKNFLTLKFICEHLYRVSEKSSVNKMSIKNLAIIFGPTLFKLPPHLDNLARVMADLPFQSSVVEMLIQYCDYVFGTIEYEEEEPADNKAKEEFEDDISDVDSMEVGADYGGWNSKKDKGDLGMFSSAQQSPANPFIKANNDLLYTSGNENSKESLSHLKPNLIKFPHSTFETNSSEIKEEKIPEFMNFSKLEEEDKLNELDSLRESLWKAKKDRRKALAINSAYFEFEVKDKFTGGYGNIGSSALGEGIAEDALSVNYRSIKRSNSFIETTSISSMNNSFTLNSLSRNKEFNGNSSIHNLSLSRHKVDCGAD
ncbi:hypothetical protein HDU92_006299 [Lobulomyces angularis]|nr:hypothetical protein HDU92_006299 [Lobulomyces angularis]